LGKADNKIINDDRRDTAKDIPRDEKIYWREEAVPGGKVTVVGC